MKFNQNALIVAMSASILLSGCAGIPALDNQDAGKGTKTAEAAGGGALIGAIAGKLFGFDPKIGALIGAGIAGFAEYHHATDLEIAAAKKKADALKAQGIASDVKTREVSVKDKDGMMKTNLQLTSFSVRSTSADAVSAVADIAQQDPFGGKIVVVAPKKDAERVKADIESIVTKKDVSVTLIDARVAHRHGYHDGIAWVPAHPGELKDGPNIATAEEARGQA